MASSRTSPHSHGRSEIWRNASLTKAFDRERQRLGKRLRGAREKLLLTQEQAAEKAGLHAKHLQRIEAGTANPTLATLVAISDAYRVKLADLLGS